MAVYNDDTIPTLHEVIKTMLKHNSAATGLELTRDEFVSAFVLPQHVGQLQEVQNLVGDVNSTNNFDFPLHFRAAATALTPAAEEIRMDTACWHNNGSPILIPKYAHGGLAETCPPELASRIRAWAEMRYDVIIACAIGASALAFLNHTCTNAKAFALAFPALTTLLARIPDPDQYARPSALKRVEAKRARALAVSKSKTVGEMPALPRSVRSMIFEASKRIDSLVFTENAVAVRTPRNGAVLMCSHAQRSGQLDDLFSEATAGYRITLT